MNEDYSNQPAFISMSCLGSLGRFANQLFQYAFLRIYAKRNNLQIEAPDWIGRVLFGQHDAFISKDRPVFREKTSILDRAIIPSSKEIFRDVDLEGFFQYHTSYYAPDRDYFQSLFVPVPQLQTELDTLTKVLYSRGKTIVAIHLRRGDFGWGTFWIAPSSWYLRWLEDIWPTLDAPVLYLATDDPADTRADFAAYRPILLDDIYSNELVLEKIAFYLDFWVLTQSDLLAISNSSFSFAAALLNKKAVHFYRPVFRDQALMLFDPWNAETRLRKTIALEAFSQITPNTAFTSEMIWLELRDQGYLNDNGELGESYKTVRKLLLSPRFAAITSEIESVLDFIIVRFAEEV